MPSSGRIPDPAALAPVALVPVVQAPAEVAPQVQAPPAELLEGTVLAVPGRITPVPATLPATTARAARVVRVVVADRATGLPADRVPSGRTVPTPAAREAEPPAARIRRTRPAATPPAPGDARGAMPRPRGP